MPGWPVSARYQNFVDGATAIVAAFEHAIQDAIIGIYGGTLSLKQLLVDAVGAATPAFPSGVIALITGGAIQLDGATGDSNPAIKTAVLPALYKALWQFALLNVSPVLNGHFYSDGGNAGPMFTVNASWNATTSKWDYDNAPSALALRVRFGTSNNFFAIDYYNGADHFADAAWVSLVAVDASKYFLRVLTTISGTTLGAAQNVPLGAIFKDTVIIAAGRIDGTNLVRSFGVSAYSRLSAGTYQITLQTPAPNFALCFGFPNDLQMLGNSYSAAFVTVVEGTSFQLITRQSSTRLDMAVNFFVIAI